MRSGFVPANRLYDAESGNRIAHPAHQATDEDVRRALADREIRADGGIDPSSSGTERFRSLVARDDWVLEERRRVEEGLAEARKWQALEPQKTDFWTTFWEGMLEVQYPSWKWRQQPQTGLGEFAGGGA